MDKKRIKIINARDCRNNLKITSKRTKHTENSIAYKIQHKNKAVVYSGDAVFSKGIIELAKNCRAMN